MHRPADVDTGGCITPISIPKNNPDYFKDLQQYVDARLGHKAGEFYTNKDNLASCKEMLQIDNEEFQRNGIIKTLTDD
jgi:hypothetical protein